MGRIFYIAAAFFWAIALANDTAAQQLFSDPATWSGKAPANGDVVTVERGQRVVIDRTTPFLRGLIVRGELIVADRPLEIRSAWIVVDGGTLAIGSPQNPVQSKIGIVLFGRQEDVLGLGMGGRLLGVVNGGSLLIHGASGRLQGWTQLARDLNPGESELMLAEAVQWPVGAEIAVAPSGFDTMEAERFRIVGVTDGGRRLVLNSAARFRHFGRAQNFEGRVLDTRAEVGLLSRNITIRGLMDRYGRRNNFGAHVMVMAAKSVQIEGVNFHNCGQLGLRGRYPFHWHLSGNRQGDFVRGSSVTDSFQRGIVVHGTQNTVVENNVVFNVIDHGIVFAEDGNEFGNRFHRNLVMVTRKKEPKNFIFPKLPEGGEVLEAQKSKQGEERASAFWGRNYNNVFTENHVAGVEQGMGFFFDDFFILGGSRTLQAIANAPTTIVFENNLAHTISAPLKNNAFYPPGTRSHALMVTRYLGDPQGVVFRKFQAYKVRGAGVWIENHTHELRESIVADSSVGVFVTRSLVDDVTLVGNSANTVGGSLQERVDTIPLGSGIFVDLFDALPRLRNLTLVNLPVAGVAIFENQPLTNRIEVSGVKLVNTRRPVLPIRVQPQNIRWTIVDVDGTLTGQRRLLGGPSIGAGARLDATLGMYVLH